MISPRIIKHIFDHKFRRTTLLIFGSLSFLGGVLYAQVGCADWMWLLPAMLLAMTIKAHKFVALVVIIYGCFILGIIRGNAALQKEDVLRQFMGQKVTINAVIADDGYYDSKRRVTFTANAFEVLSPKNINIDVPLRINTFVMPSATRGEVVHVTGKLYPTLGNVAGSIGFAEVETVGTIATFLDNARQKFTTGLRNSLPEPTASFAAGILIGQRSSLTTRWQDIIRDAGLMHVIAVSGYNLTILVRFSKRLLQKQSRYQILMASGLLVTIFVLITGMSPSILRATIVVALLQLSWFYGRKIHPLVLLTLSAALSVIYDPFQLWRSVGWYLSFAAFFGVIILAPLLVPKKKEKSIFWLLIAESLSAGLLTLPIIATVFGRVSVVGILANLLVTPLVPLSMLLSLIAGLAGWLVPAISGWFALPARFLLTYMLDIANIVSRLPGARISMRVNNWMLLGIYTVICGGIWFLYKRRKPQQYMLE
jgi:competence protein ComEC